MDKITTPAFAARREALLEKFLDYRRPLFQLEQWSPFLAKKIWGLATLMESPLTLALGFRIRHLTDLNSEVAISYNRINREANGQLKPSVLLAAGEFASKILWQRHLNPQFDEISISSIHCRFLKPAVGPVHVRTNMNEADRERLLRKIRTGESTECDMPIVIMDSRDQQIASMNCVWNLKTLRPAALSEGSAKSGKF